MHTEFVSPELQREDTDFEVRSLDTSCINISQLQHPWWYNLKYLLAGVFFGIILIKAEVVSWFRIQEMFRLQSFHMYGVIGSAIVVGMISVWLIKRLKAKSVEGEKVVLGGHSGLHNPRSPNSKLIIQNS